MTNAKLSKCVLSACVHLSFLWKEEGMVSAAANLFDFDMVKHLDPCIRHKHLLEEAHVSNIFRLLCCLRCILVISFLLLGECAESKLSLQARATCQHLIWQCCEHRVFWARRYFKHDLVFKLLNNCWWVNMRDVNSFKIKTLVGVRGRTHSFWFATHWIYLVLSLQIVVFSELISVLWGAQIEINTKLSVSRLAPCIDLTSYCKRQRMLLSTGNLHDLTVEAHFNWHGFEVPVLVCNSFVKRLLVFIPNCGSRCLASWPFVHFETELATRIASHSHQFPFLSQDNWMLFSASYLVDCHFKCSDYRRYELLWVQPCFQIFFCDFFIFFLLRFRNSKLSEVILAPQVQISV